MMLFPPELRDLVIDGLHSDTAALRACSLTCKAWLPRVRHHLFRTVHIHPGPRGDAFKLLLEANPEIGRYIRDVSISGVATSPSTATLPVLSGRWPTLSAVNDEPPSTLKKPELRCVHWLQSVLPASTKILARVRALTLFSLPIHQALAQLLGSHFGQVLIVKLDACKAETFGDLLSLPRALTEVEHLRMDSVTWYRSTYPKLPTQAVSKQSSLKSLALTARVDSATIINWLVANRRYTSLTSLSVLLSSECSVRAAQLLLDTVGPSLHELSIGFSDHIRDPTGTQFYAPEKNENELSHA